MLTNGQTNRQPTTVTLAAHARRGLITGAASSRYALEVERTSEQSTGKRLRYVRTTHARSHTHPRSAHAQKLQIRAEHPPFTYPGYATVQSLYTYFVIS